MSDLEKSNLNIIVPGTGCCSSEIFAARGPVYDIQRFGVNIVTIPEEANILVISGILSPAMIDRFRDIYRKMRPPRWVFAAGSCVISGGRLSGAPVLLERFKKETKINMYIPGCPPRPEAFIYALIRFMASNVEIGNPKVKYV